MSILPRLFLAVLAATALVPTEVRAQQPPSDFDLVQLQTRYESALKTCEAAVLARQADQPTWETLLSRVEAARRSGDDEAWEEAQQLFYQHSLVMENRQRRVRESCDVAEEARAAYAAGLDDRRRELERDIEVIEEPARRRNALALLADVENRYDELTEARSALEVLPAMRPLIDIRRTDTPDAIRGKAEFLERRVTAIDSLLVDLDEEIERLESRIESSRRRANFRAPADRFDDITPPVVSGPPGREGSAGEEPGTGDSLQARLREVRNARQQLDFYRNEVVLRLREFRAYLRTIT